MDLELSGKRAIVVGGSRGIGRAIARALVEEGARVLIAARNGDQVVQTVAELGKDGGDVYGHIVDVRHDRSVDALIDAAVDILGGIDILVNSVTVVGKTPTIPGDAGPGIAHITSEHVLEEIDTKLVGYLRVSRAAAPHLVRQGWGRIINISGLAARQTGKLSGSVRNVAVAALSKTLADELGPKGVNVTVVHPGATRTERTAEIVARRAAKDGVSDEEAEKRLYGGSLIGRIVEAEEVAAVVVFLASPKSVAINGDAIAVGGGARHAIHY
jgi:NAD(P)-dependent dehydrogenase (short-subunit alcohol dehydrogenase family)